MASVKKLLFIALTILSLSSIISGADEQQEDSKIITTTQPSTTTGSNSTTASPTTTPSTVPTTWSPSTPVTSTTIPTTATPTTTTPPPHEKDYTWTVKDPITGHICIIAHMKIQLDIPYTNTSEKVAMAHVMVPENATGSGTCNSSMPSVNQTLTLRWGDSNSTSLVTLTFTSNVTSKHFWLSSIAAVVAVDNTTFPGIKGIVRQVKLVNNTQHFVTPMDNSYNCPSLLNVPALLVPEVINHTAYFTLDHFQLQAFKNSTSNNFSTAIYCEQDNTPDLVPILVGCSLVALVVIVLAVYLWGRRRSQQRGYLSM